MELLEQRYSNNEIELFYGDEVQVSEEAYVPYGWQFKDENISVKSAKGKKLNCFGMITRRNDFVFETTYDIIDSSFIIEQINKFSNTIKKHTVIVLDNAKVHQSKVFKKMKEVWAKKQLFIFYLPPYSPQLNIIERLWKEMKERWIDIKNYEETDQLFYATKLVLNEIGKSLKLKYKIV